MDSTLPPSASSNHEPHANNHAATPAPAPHAAHPEAIAQPGVAAAPTSTNIDAQTQSEIDDAMAAIGMGERTGPAGAGGAARKGGGGGMGGGGGGGGFKKKDQRPKPPSTLPGHDVAPIGGAAKAALKGPRVVTAGREHRSGMVVSVGPSDIFLEFGPKELGVAPRTQWPEDQLPVVGTQLEVVIDRFEPSESLFVCSRPGAVVKAAWETLAVGQTVDAKVVGVNKGGLELEVAGHRAFMPASQVSLDRIPDLSVMIGEKLTCTVSQLDTRGRGNIVLSRRDLLAVERKDRAAKLRESLKEGDSLDGTVRKIMPFGAFVDVGGVDGLVHISDLTHDRIGFGEQAIAKVLKEGQAVKVKILKLEWNESDIKKSRISLGMKQLLSDPFTTAAADIKEGAEVTGRITRLADFGAFIEIASGVEGLCHVSEIAHRRINHPQDVLKQDQVVQCKVLKVDPETRRIGLSLKALLAMPEPVAAPGGGGGGGRGGRGGKDRMPMRSIEEITKETPAMRRLRAQAALKVKSKGGELKGGF